MIDVRQAEAHGERHVVDAIPALELGQAGVEALGRLVQGAAAEHRDQERELAKRLVASAMTPEQAVELGLPRAPRYRRSRCEDNFGT